MQIVQIQSQYRRKTAFATMRSTNLLQITQQMPRYRPILGRGNSQMRNSEEPLWSNSQLLQRRPAMHILIYPRHTSAHQNVLYKTRLCRHYERHGVCLSGETCLFAHGINELRLPQNHPKYRTKECEMFTRMGFCGYGSQCHFIHADIILAVVTSFMHICLHSYSLLLLLLRNITDLINRQLVLTNFKGDLDGGIAQHDVIFDTGYYRLRASGWCFNYYWQDYN
ncbi:unnamed protein product [Mesocestoides corti]|uniref:C3H1-type domain-containing protein n=1 Tax=Mesocestoides corti TaxID=53468 RepID=A0A0R3U898_MESCO|nr:unnamed protein product [Mesocestoides corti]